MNYQRTIAGFFVGLGSLILLYQGHIDVGAALLSGMLAFFVGEENGKRKTT